MSGFVYVAKVSRIYVTTLAVAGTWYEVLSAANAKSIRGVKIQSRMKWKSNGSPQYSVRPFDMAFSSAPDTSDAVTDGTGYISVFNGVSDVFGPVTGVWVRSAVAGAIIETQVYD
jgi:hypothetical protein